MRLIFYRLLFFFLTSFATRQTDAFDQIRLLAVPIVNTPEIQKEKVIYSIDFVFNRCPHEYMLYYDRFQKKMVIDFYSGLVSWADSVKKQTFPGKISIKNIETAMSIFNKKGQILFTLQKGWNYKQGWHFESSVISSSTLRIKFWIELRPVVKVQKKE
jgi:hypothetical protein